VAGPSPTLRRRELANRLRELRKQSGLTVEEVARHLLCSIPKISRIETGTRSPTLRDVRDLCVLYKVGEAEQARLMSIAQESKQQGWWSKFDDLDIEVLIGLEIEAKRISSYEYNVPWPFQTEEYARAIIKGALPRIDDRILSSRVAARMARQELLRSPNPPHMWYLIDESAFRRIIGGKQVMSEQLAKMLDVAATPSVTMQVVPFEAGAHPGLDNTFTLLEFDRSVLAPVVFVENNFAGNLYIEREAEIERYREALEHLRACALSPANSARWVNEVREKFAE
jgi:transcriptional regulator with XRE-family HTH domain